MPTMLYETVSVVPSDLVAVTVTGSGVIVRSRRSSPRCTVSTIGPVASRMTGVRSAALPTGAPFTATISSPGRRPADAAGPGPVHGELVCLPSAMVMVDDTHWVPATLAGVGGGLRSGRPKVSPTM